MKFQILQIALSTFPTLAPLAYPSTTVVVGRSEESILVMDCTEPYDLSGFNFKKDFDNVIQNGRSQCPINAERVGNYQLEVKCFKSHIFNTMFLAVNFSADFKCE